MNNLKMIRKRLGITLEELSKSTAIPVSTLNRAENGVRDMRGQLWKIVSDALCVSMDELMGKET